MALEQETADCSICLEELDPEGPIPVFQLSCLHLFHTECINRWFGANNNMTCPLCRNHELPLQVVPAAYEVRRPLPPVAEVRAFTVLFVAVVSVVLAFSRRRH